MVRDGFEGLGEGVHVRLRFDKHGRWATTLQREAFGLVQIVCARGPPEFCASCRTLEVLRILMLVGPAHLREPHLVAPIDTYTHSTSQLFAVDFWLCTYLSTMEGLQAVV